MFEDQKSLNLPAEKFNDLRANFIVNVNETSVVVSEETVKVIGDVNRKNTQKNICGKIDSTTIIGVSNKWAAYANGPHVFWRNTKE